MFYTIYKITNKINGKIYVGKHQTKDLNDGYMGSGKHLKKAQNKYGIENFEKEILFQFDNEAEMNAKEAELVTEEFCLREDNYNICPGGRGGFGYINTNNLGGKYPDKTEKDLYKLQLASQKLSGCWEDRNWYEARSKKISFSLKSRFENVDPHFLGKRHTDESKKRMSEAKKNKSKGPDNSQYGTMWITNGLVSMKIRKDEDVPIDWRRGRVIKNTECQ